MILRNKSLGGEEMGRNEVVRAFEKTRHYARMYVREHCEELERQYGERYLAIAENAGVIDSDENKFLLIKRLQASCDQRGIVIDTIVHLTKPEVSHN